MTIHQINKRSPVNRHSLPAFPNSMLLSSCPWITIPIVMPQQSCHDWNRDPQLSFCAWGRIDIIRRSVASPMPATAGCLKLHHQFIPIMKQPTLDHKKAQLHLSRRDPVLKKLIRKVGPCTLQLMPNPFHVLVRSIISQQLSTKAAATIHGRLVESLKGRAPTPASLLKQEVESLRSCGLSRAKVASLQDLSTKVLEKVVPLNRLDALLQVVLHFVLIPRVTMHGIPI